MRLKVLMCLLFLSQPLFSQMHSESYTMNGGFFSSNASESNDYLLKGAFSCFGGIPQANGFWLGPFPPVFYESTGVGHGTNLPITTKLHQNYPNPFNPQTTIGFTLATASNAKVVIYNLLGEVVRVLKDDLITPGYHHVQWDGKDSYGSYVSSGVYFYTLEGEHITDTRKMIMLR